MSSFSLDSKRLKEKSKLTVKPRKHSDTSKDDTDGIGFKIPRLGMPEGYKRTVDPFFQLPEKFRHPPKSQKPRPVPLRTSKNAIESYSAMREKKEKFRKYIISLVIHDVNKLKDAKEIPIHPEKDINRYYYYIRNGFDTIHVPPMDMKLFHKVKVESQEAHLTFKRNLTLNLTYKFYFA